LKKIIALLAIILVIVGIITWYVTRDNTQESGVTSQVVRVNEVTRSVFYAPQYVAISEGFFSKRGIEVELTTGQGADTVMTAVLAGQSDIGFAGPEASIYVYNEGKEDHTQVFAQLTKRDGSFLVSKTNTTNFKWSDLIGKTVIPGRKGGVPYMTLEYVLKQNGINPKTDLVLDDSIKFDLMAGAFAGGNADYVTLFEPTASSTEIAGKGYIVAAVGTATEEIPYTAYFAKKSYIQNNEDLIQKFTDAIYEGQVWAKEHTSKEIAETIQEFFPDTDINLLEKVIQRYKDIDAWSENPILTEESFNLLQTVMSEAGELEKKADYTKVVNNKYAKEAIK